MDNQAIAREIVGKLNIGANILDTKQLSHDSHALGVIERADGFS
ncbi:MAG TPA: hypothetical protein VG603_11210 [Chitinophagales bacterium]|nr:hypothetical protein [Chitinophagales bacterium]